MAPALPLFEPGKNEPPPRKYTKATRTHNTDERVHPSFSESGRDQPAHQGKERRVDRNEALVRLADERQQAKREEIDRGQSASCKTATGTEGAGEELFGVKG